MEKDCLKKLTEYFTEKEEESKKDIESIKTIKEITRVAYTEGFKDCLKFLNVVKGELTGLDEFINMIYEER